MNNSAHFNFKHKISVTQFTFFSVNLELIVPPMTICNKILLNISKISLILKLIVQIKLGIMSSIIGYIYAHVQDTE
jgi:hypothetical protein